MYICTCIWLLLWKYTHTYNIRKYIKRVCLCICVCKNMYPCFFMTRLRGNYNGHSHHTKHLIIVTLFFVVYIYLLLTIFRSLYLSASTLSLKITSWPKTLVQTIKKYNALFLCINFLINALQFLILEMLSISIRLCEYRLFNKRLRLL